MSRNQILVSLVAAALLVLGAAWYLLGERSDGTLATVAAAPAATPYDRTLGDPKAPVTVIEYAAPQCPFCAQMNAEGIPVLKARYIDTGKVFYIFRVFPVGPADLPAEGIARCLPAARYFAFIDMLYRNQAKWDPENGVTDVGAALLAMGQSAGLGKDRTIACMTDEAAQKRLIAAAIDAQARYGITGTPTFIVNGETQAAGAPWPDIQAKLDTLLAGK